MRRQVQQLSVVLAAALLCLGGCKKDDVAKVADVPPMAPGPVAAAPEAPAGEKPYEASVAVEGTVTVGDKGTLLTRLAAKPGFHVNPDYPANFKPDGANKAIVFDQPRYELKEDAEKMPCADKPEDTCELRGKVPFTASVNGPTSASGVMAFSVCSKDKCLIEKVPVTVALDVH